jgi:hypothetical protein
VDTDPTSIKPAPRRRLRWFTWCCLSVLIIAVLCVGLSVVAILIAPPIQSGRAADSYLNSVKADKHIQSWNFTSRQVSSWNGEAGIEGGNIANFSGDVTYDDGQHGTVTMVLRDDGFLNFLSENWRVETAQFGSKQDLFSTR